MDRHTGHYTLDWHDARLDQSFLPLPPSLQDDAWQVITAFFLAKGLVRQQLDSFNDFVSNTMQEIIDENPGT